MSGVHLVERMDWPPFWDEELRAKAEACPSSAFGVEASAEWGRRAGEAGAGEPEGSGREAEASGLRFRMTQPGGALQRRARGLLPTEDHTLSLWGILSKETHHRPAEGARRGSEAMERLKYRPVPAHNPSPPSASHPFSQTPAKSPTAESVGQLSQDYF